MADDEKGPLGRLMSGLTDRFRRKTTPEPIMPLWKAGIQEPVLVQGVSIPALYATVQESIILRTTLNTLSQEIFRRGHFWSKKFHKKCFDCGEEYQHDVDECRFCDGTELKTPDPDQVIYPRWLIDQRNSMDQAFVDVMREIEHDLDVVDDAFLILIKEYFLDPDDGSMQFYRVKELLRGDPTFIRIVSDKKGVRGGRYLICPVHRDRTYPHTGDHDECEVCRLELQDVHFINTAGSGKTQYYIDGEVLHTSKFNPSKLYGRSPVATMWRQAMTLSAMDNFMYLSYQKRRMPRGVLAITTDNIQSTASFWKGAEEKMERDPHYIPKVGIESATGRGRVEFVRFMDTLDEMQYGAVRDELRMRIAAFYGVSNIFMMDTGKSGGLNNEGLQILVTNRAVEYGQKLYSRELFPRLLAEMGAIDWELSLRPNEEEDDVTRLRRDEMEVNIAQRMQALGFQPELTEDAGRDIRFIYRVPSAEELEAQNMAAQGQPAPPPAGVPQPGGQPPPGGPPPGGPLPGGQPLGRGGPPQIAAPPPGGPVPGGSPPGGAPPGRHAESGAPLIRRSVAKAAGLGESTGKRDRGPSSPDNVTQLSGGRPKTKQRGKEPSPEEKARLAVEGAIEAANDPLGNQKDPNSFTQ